MALVFTGSGIISVSYLTPQFLEGSNDYQELKFKQTIKKGNSNDILALYKLCACHFYGGLRTTELKRDRARWCSSLAVHQDHPEN